MAKQQSGQDATLGRMFLIFPCKQTGGPEPDLMWNTLICCCSRMEIDIDMQWNLKMMVGWKNILQNRSWSWLKKKLSCVFWDISCGIAMQWSRALICFSCPLPSCESLPVDAASPWWPAHSPVCRWGRGCVWSPAGQRGSVSLAWLSSPPCPPSVSAETTTRFQDWGNHWRYNSSHVHLDM